MKENTDEAQARTKAQMILKVQTGILSASEAAKALGISRKTYYKWEKRGLSAMLKGLCERSCGRPARGRDEEKEHLEKEARNLKKELSGHQRKQKLRDDLRSESKKKG